MKAKATVRLHFSSKNHLETLFRALSPEASRPPNLRAVTVLEKEGNFLALRVEASDTIALRATLNAYLRWISSITNVLNILEQNS